MRGAVQALGAAVVGVDRQRVAEERQVRAHLVQPAGPRAQLDRRVGERASPALTAEPLQRPPGGHAGLPAASPGRAGRTLPPRIGTSARSISPGAEQRAAAQTPVALVDLMPLERHRQRAVRLGREGEQQHARGPAIQAVHDEDVAAQRSARSSRSVALARGGSASGNDDAPRRFGERRPARHHGIRMSSTGPAR